MTDMHLLQVTQPRYYPPLYRRLPAQIRGLNIGDCCEKWSWKYLAERGAGKEVKVHVGVDPQMDFLHKNFAYRSLKFDDLIRRIEEEKSQEYFFSENEVYYLRSLGSDVRNDTADISIDFPELAPDVTIPKFFEETQFFSSVFRISSKGLQLWTHYDVMDNVLMVVTGRKRVVMFPPSDALFLYLNGDKSEVMDIDNVDVKRFPDFLKASRYECILEPGDVLFIPALWFHNVINLEAGVAVNAFWRHLLATEYDTKDVYGNRPPVVAARAMQAVDRAVASLDKLPAEYRDFYARAMICRIRQKLDFVPKT